MKPYATRQDLIDRYGEDEILQRESMLPAQAVEDALRDAAATVDDYLRASYAVPLVRVPPTVVRLTCDIGRYLLLGESVTEEARDRYRDAIAQLRDIAAGRMQLDAGLLPDGAARGEVVVESVAPVFKRHRRGGLP
ncbi:MAG: DUF1320 domain-containing protein [Betaproteobacteria bacterium]|nr:DUF1320 domain-containing protein [Betaproteobacteria bacterium]